MSTLAKAIAIQQFYRRRDALSAKKSTIFGHSFACGTTRCMNKAK